MKLLPIFHFWHPSFCIYQLFYKYLYKALPLSALPIMLSAILSHGVPPFENCTSYDYHISYNAQHVRDLIQEYKSQYSRKYDLTVVKYRYLPGWSLLVCCGYTELSTSRRKSGTEQAHNLLPCHRCVVQYDKWKRHQTWEYRETHDYDRSALPPVFQAFSHRCRLFLPQGRLPHQPWHTENPYETKASQRTMHQRKPAQQMPTLLGLPVPSTQSMMRW